MSPARPGVARALAVLIALVIAVVAFLFRFNALGGSLGGFDNEEFATLTRVDMVLSGQQPLRDFADGELRAVWPSLSFEVPALAQRTFGRNLYVYATLTLGALAGSAAVVFLLARDLSRRWLVAVLAAGVVITSATVSYNYQKVLPLTLGVAAIRWALLRSTPLRLGVLAASTVIAALFRHDYGVYVAVGAVAGLVACELRPWTAPLRRLGIYAAFLVILSLPSAIWVEHYEGVVKYAGDVIQAIRTDAGTNPPLPGWPALNPASPFDRNNLIAFNYFAYWAMAAAGLVVLLARGRSRQTRGFDADFAFGVALVAMTPVVNYYFLRSHLQARFGDAIVPMALLGPWMVGSAPLFASRAARLLAGLAPTAVLALMCAAFFPINEIPSQLRVGGFNESVPVVTSRFGEVKRTLAALPPDDWTGVDHTGDMGASRYLSQCTRPDDYVLDGTYVDDVLYFARRRFAGGQAYFAFSFLRGEADQRRVIERLGRQSVPVFLTAIDYQHEFVENYPVVARYIAERYREVGIIEADGKPFVRVFVEAARQPTGTDPVLGFPCFK